MTVWPASFFFWGASGICRGYSRPLSIPPTSPREPEWSLFETPPKPLPQPTSARGPCTQMSQWHPRAAKGLSIGSLAGLRHGDPPHRYLRGIPVWRMASRPVHDRQLTDALTGLRHGDPAHRHLSGILAWRGGLLSALWHGDPQLKHFWGRVACRREGNRYR